MSFARRDKSSVEGAGGQLKFPAQQSVTVGPLRWIEFGHQFVEKLRMSICHSQLCFRVSVRQRPQPPVAVVVLKGSEVPSDGSLCPYTGPRMACPLSKGRRSLHPSTFLVKRRQGEAGMNQIRRWTEGSLGGKTMFKLHHEWRSRLHG